MLGGRTNHWGRIFPAQRSLRLQAAQPRRSRVRLADRLRGPRAVLRQGGNADRRLRRERRTGEHAGLAARLPAAAAEAAGQRPAGRSSARSGSAFRSSPATSAVLTQRARFQASADRCCIPAIRMRRRFSRTHMNSRAAVLLGDALRARLLDPRELSVDDRASAARARDRQTRHPRPMRWCAR